MSYMQKIEERLRALLRGFLDGGGVDLESVIRELKAKLLESYRNGQRDCPKCNPKPVKASQEAA